MSFVAPIVQGGGKKKMVKKSVNKKSVKKSVKKSPVRKSPVRKSPARKSPARKSPARARKSPVRQRRGGNVVRVSSSKHHGGKEQTMFDSLKNLFGTGKSKSAKKN